MTAPTGTQVAARAGCSGFQGTDSSAANLTTLRSQASGLRLTGSGGPFFERGEQQGTFRLVDSGGAVREVEYTAKGNALPDRHVLALRDKSARDNSAKLRQSAGAGESPAWVQDYALFLLDAGGRVTGWYSGAERIYGYQSQEIVGEPASCLCPGEDALGLQLKEELQRAAAQGHFGNEGWHTRKDGSRFWANALTMALRGEDGELHGFARVVRDFSKRRLTQEKLHRGGVVRLLSGESAKESTIAGVVSGEFDHITDANDAFLQMVGSLPSGYRLSAPSN